MLVTTSLRHCSNKYKLAREGIDKEEVFFYFYFFGSLGWSQVVSKEMSFQLLLEDWQWSSIPDRGGKIIPPARNGERECSGEWFWASLWWYHEASLTSRSQTSGGDVDSRVIGKKQKCLVTRILSNIFFSEERKSYRFRITWASK